MMSTVIWHILVFLLLLLKKSSDAKQISECLFDADVIPDVIDEAPLRFVKIVYGFNVIHLNCGFELTPRRVKQKPAIYWAFDTNKFYTVIMFDPYAPFIAKANPRNNQFIHWMVVNIQGKDIHRGATLVEYVGAGPPANGELHPYVFMVFDQNCTLEFDMPYLSITDGRRGNFNVRNFMQLHKLGTPIAANYFVAKYDSYVPFWQKQLGQFSQK